MKVVKAIIAIVAVAAAAYVVYHYYQKGQVSRLNNEAVALLNQSQYAQARDILERAKAKAPTNASVWKNLGICYDELNDNEKALEAFERSLALSPNQPDVRPKIEELRALLKAQEKAPK